MEIIKQTIERIVREVFGQSMTVALTRTAEQFGDLSTNVAMQLAGRLQQPPRDVATRLVEELRTALADNIRDISVAGPGFINITLSDARIAAQADTAPATKPQTFADQVVVTEYSDPNPFKVLHAGHLYTSIVGDVVSNLVAASGGEVHRVNFGGDVGLHVGKTMWAIVQELGGEFPEKLESIAVDKRAEWMATCYVAGTNAYEDNDQAKAAIIDLNKRVYKIFADDDHDSPFARMYWTCRQWSYDYFDAFYQRIGTPFEKYYPESAVTPLGLATVREQLAKGVYAESNDAVVFVGEPYGLHTRVFINSHGLPTYEAKDVGLIMTKWHDYHFDRSVVITGNDIVEYMKVVLKSIEQFAPELVQRTMHFTHGNVKLQGGIKMSSRKGNILRAVDVLDAASAANKEATGRDDDERTILGAVKYAFLKQRIGGDIIYDPQESVSLEGNSGPYLQYAHARARSILRKAGNRPMELGDTFDAAERSLARKISEYPEIIEKAVNELMPHHIAVYLYELAQVFNRFYEQAKVLDDPREAIRLRLVTLYADVLHDGLGLLGITAPDRM